MNLAASFVFLKKESNTASITLINGKNQKILFTSTKFYQGKDNYLYGPPYTITVGIPKHEDNGTTTDQVIAQRTLIDMIRGRYISPEDLFGSAKFLSVMLNHGSKNTILAWNEAHRKLLLALDIKSKVFRI